MNFMNQIHSGLSMCFFTAFVLMSSQTGRGGDTNLAGNNLASTNIQTTAETKNLLTAEAWDVWPVKEISIFGGCNALPAFSHDCKKIAYVIVKSDDNQIALSSSIVVKNLDGAMTESSWFIGDSGIECLGWSPNDKRIVFIMSDQKIKILEPDSGKVIDLPIVSEPHSYVMWDSEKEIYFDSNTRLNLDTLQFENVYTSYQTLFNKMYPSPNPNFTFKECNNFFMMDSIGRVAALLVSSTKKDYGKCILYAPSMLGGAHPSFVWSSDLSYIAETWHESTFHGNRLKLSIFKMGVVLGSQTEFTVENLQGVDGQDQPLANLLSGDQTATADVIEAQVNPLNGKPIANWGNPQLRGLAKISLKDGKIHATPWIELKPFNSGDLVGNFRPGYNLSGKLDVSIWGVLTNENPPEVVNAADQLQLALRFLGEKNYTEANKWLRKASDQGNAMAQRDLGMSYERGNGVDKDYAQAISWFRKAADQGDSIAEFKLGEMYENGWGVDKSNAEAINWYQKSADKGYRFAKQALQRINNGQ